VLKAGGFGTYVPAAGTKPSLQANIEEPSMELSMVLMSSATYVPSGNRDKADGSRLVKCDAKDLEMDHRQAGG
jgi:hypothetical protein